jgi:hypothetical protein
VEAVAAAPELLGWSVGLGDFSPRPNFSAEPGLMDLKLGAIGWPPKGSEGARIFLRLLRILAAKWPGLVGATPAIRQSLGRIDGEAVRR